MRSSASTRPPTNTPTHPSSPTHADAPTYQTVGPYTPYTAELHPPISPRETPGAYPDNPASYSPYNPSRATPQDSAQCPCDIVETSFSLA